MSGVTGYLTIDNIDLSYVLQTGTSAIKSGFLLQNGNDIGTTFAALSVNYGYLWIKWNGHIRLV